MLSSSRCRRWQEAAWLKVSQSDLDVNAQIEQLAREKDAKLPGLKIFQGVDPRIPNGRIVNEEADENDLELFWKDPDDNRFDHNVNSINAVTSVN